MLTAWHVVRDIYGSPEKVNQPVHARIYLEDGTTTVEAARMVAYDSALDVALLKLDSDRAIPNGARLASRESLERAKIFDGIYAVGCPLGNDPIPTAGEIAATNHKVDGCTYWMISAPTYIGNSGGGIFDARSHELMGIFSKIYTHGATRSTIVPHMGLATPLSKVYDWLEGAGRPDIVPGPLGIGPQTASAPR
jgi:S1-C subfamily serine protease